MRAHVGIGAALFFLLGFENCSDPQSPDPVKDPRQYSWTIDTLRSPGGAQLLITGIWGSSLTDVYAVGFCGEAVSTMFHYDGTAWSPIPMNAAVGGPVQGLAELTAIRGFSTRSIFAAGSKSDPPLGTIVHFDGNALSIVDSQFVRPGEPPDHFGPELKYCEGTLFSAGKGVFTAVDGAWQQIYRPPRPILSLACRSSADLFAVGTHALVLHFNGSSWHQFSIPLPDIPLTSSWVYDEGVFITGCDGGKSFIIRGG